MPERELVAAIIRDGFETLRDSCRAEDIKREMRFFFTDPEMFDYYANAIDLDPDVVRERLMTEVFGPGKDLERPLYTAKEIAKKLEIGESTFRRWVDDGLVNSSAKSGGHSPRRRYTEKDLKRARVVKALVSSPHGLRGERLRAKVGRIMGELR